MTDLDIEEAIVTRLKSVVPDGWRVDAVSKPAQLEGEGLIGNTILVLFNRNQFGRPGTGRFGTMNTQDWDFEIAIAVASKDLRETGGHKGAAEMKQIVRDGLSGWEYDGGHRMYVKNDFLVPVARKLGIWMYQIMVGGTRTYITGQGNG